MTILSTMKLLSGVFFLFLGPIPIHGEPVLFRSALRYCRSIRIDVKHDATVGQVKEILRSHCPGLREDGYSGIDLICNGERLPRKRHFFPVPYTYFPTGENAVYFIPVVGSDKSEK